MPVLPMPACPALGRDRLPAGRQGAGRQGLPYPSRTTFLSTEANDGRRNSPPSETSFSRILLRRGDQPSAEGDSGSDLEKGEAFEGFGV